MDQSVFLLLYCLSVGSFTFIMLCGQAKPFRDGPVGKAHWLLTEGVPAYTAVAARRVFGERIARLAGRAVNYLAQTAHPLLQVGLRCESPMLPCTADYCLDTGASIVYVFLVAAGSLAFYATGAYRIPNEYIPEYHLYVIPAVIGTAAISFVKAATVDPGKLTRENIDKLCKKYPYDGLIFPGPKECRTCRLIKPPRSKHCSLCGACIARSCHHCPWINNCVGLYSHRYFLFFLLSNVVLTGYGSYICFLLIYKDILLVARLKFLSLTHKAAFVLQRDPYIASLFLFCSLVCLVIGGFFLWHLYLVAIGVTTNESFKWDDLEESIKDGILYVVAEKAAKPGAPPALSADVNGDTEVEYLLQTTGTEEPAPCASKGDAVVDRGRTTAPGSSKKATKRKGKVGAAGEAPQFMPPAPAPAGPWERRARRKTPTVDHGPQSQPNLILVKDFKELKNIYNNGVLRNFLDVLLPGR